MHRRHGEPCQDHAFATLIPTATEMVLVAACADGAGGSALSAAGSRLACETIIQEIYQDVKAGLRPAEIDRSRVRQWYQAARKVLVTEARARRVPLHELACTLLTAVVGDAHAVFAQVGDGAMVTLEKDVYQPVFWPQLEPHGHTTNFLVDPHLAERLDFRALDTRVEELALFTDGLQHLALNFKTRQARQPFFGKLFLPLRQASEGDDLTLPLRALLNSASLNRRTNDDKTLVLGSRSPLGETKSQ